jgi:hypothetical protein
VLGSFPLFGVILRSSRTAASEPDGDDRHATEGNHDPGEERGDVHRLVPRRSSGAICSATRATFTASVQRDADHYERCTEREEAEIPRERIRDVIANVVHRQDVVVDDAFDQVEDAPADEHQSDVREPRRREIATLPGAHGQGDTDERHDPRREVEHAVRQRVVLEAGDAGGWMITGRREHVMPLEDLVEQDPVDESSQPDTEQHCGRAWARTPSRPFTEPA